MTARRSVRLSVVVGVILSIAACGVAAPSAVTTPSAITTPSAVLRTQTTDASPTLTPTGTLPPAAFPIELFAGMGDEAVPDALAAELQAVLETSADGQGVTAALVTAQGTWTGATGFAAGKRPMRPDDQMAIASITKTLVAAQVMRLVEAGQLRLDDRAEDRLPPGLGFDANGATIENLLSMRSGIPENLQDPEDWDSLTSDPLREWTPAEVLATVGQERGPVGQAVEYRGNNYLLLRLILEEATGRPLAQVLRSGILAGGGYERLVYQPDERPTDPVAMPDGGPAAAFQDVGGFLPTLAAASAFGGDGNMASDAITVARWFQGLCAGEVVSTTALTEMADFDKRPEYGLGLMDRSAEYFSNSGALGHTGAIFGYTTAALCFRDPASVVVVLANAEHDVDTLAGKLVQAAGT